MITIANHEKYRAGLYERLSNENIEVASGGVVVSKDDELVSGSISTQKIYFNIPNYKSRFSFVMNKKFNFSIDKHLLI